MAGAALSPAEIVAAAAGGANCAATLAPLRRPACAGAGGVINLLDPDVIVLGGGLSNIDALYDEVPSRWLPHVFSDAVSTVWCGRRMAILPA
jgi:fructokinase